MMQLIAPITLGPLAWYAATAGRQRVTASMLLPYGLPRLSAGVDLPYGVAAPCHSTVVMPYGPATRYRTTAIIALPWAQVLAGAISFPWSTARRNTMGVSVLWSTAPVCRSALSVPWLVRSPISISLLTPWAGDALDQAAAALLMPWSESTTAWRSLDAEPLLFWQGDALPLLSASLSTDEGSPYWLAQVRLAHRADYDRLPDGATVILRLVGENYALVVDGRTLSQGESGETDLNISARSPICRADATFFAPALYYNESPVSAHDYVLGLLTAVAPVEWQLLDWTIPAGRIAQDRATPLAVATAIVSAVGGLIESLPDGRVVCRPRHAVRPCSPGFDLALMPGNVFVHGEALAPGAIFNSIVVSDSSESPHGDVLEFTPSETNPLHGTVRAWPSPWRPVTLVHTSLGVSIGNREDREEAQEEVLEIVAGTAQTRYPASQITGREWLHVDLGHASVSNQQVATTLPGYSLLRLNYTTRCYAWEVSRPDPAEVQFLLMEESP